MLNYLPKDGNVSCKTSVLNGTDRVDFVTLGNKSSNRPEANVPFSEDAYASNSSQSDERDYSCGEIDLKVNNVKR